MESLPDRRRFFLSVAALAVGGGTGGTVATTELSPREFHRYDYATGSWTAVAGFDVRVGDVVRIYDPPDGYDEVVFVSRNEPKEGQLFVTHRIDKTTNQWTTEWPEGS